MRASIVASTASLKEPLFPRTTCHKDTLTNPKFIEIPVPRLVVKCCINLVYDFTTEYEFNLSQTKGLFFTETQPSGLPPGSVGEYVETC